MEDSVKNIKIADFDYPLPDDKIARYPAEPRDSSKLLLFKKGEVSEDVYSHLADHLTADSLLLFNQTRVVQARLKFPKNETTVIEVFCLAPMEGQDIQQAMQSISPVRYQCLVGGAKKWKNGPLTLEMPGGEKLQAEKIDRALDSFVIEFSWEGDRHFADILEEAGKTPLPPYLNREAEDTDKERYQTLFAREDGSVAAPTAGLHFTDSLFKKLVQKGIQTEYLTLHVGAGTFKPVSSEKVAGHQMHSEEFFVSAALVREILKASSKKIIPVGTTSMRALESLYWLGVLALNSENENFIWEVDQWEPYRHDDPPAPDEALAALLQLLESQKREWATARTSLMIAPGYRHRLCKGLLTNFHQPKSTLLLLVASLIGEDWKTLYQYALQHNFRFLSYGDGCLILRD